MTKYKDMEKYKHYNYIENMEKSYCSKYKTKSIFYADCTDKKIIKNALIIAFVVYVLFIK